MRLIDYTIFHMKGKPCVLWINYKDDKDEDIHIEVSMNKILDLLMDAKEIIDYQDDQLVILPDTMNVKLKKVHKLRSSRIITDVTTFWNSYIYKDKAIELYLNTLNHG